MRPDAAALKEDVPSGAVRSDAALPADAAPGDVETAGERAGHGGLPEAERAVENEDREGHRLGRTQG